MNVLISADKFKDCLGAQAVCAIIAEEIDRAQPGHVLRLCPLSDGGDGFASVLTTAADGILAGEEISDPLGRPTQAAFGIVPVENIPPKAIERLGLPDPLPEDARIAVVEMAAASGLQLLQETERNPWQTDTTGTGELIRAAQRADVAAIVLGVGGSATNDLGLGALAALGYRFLDAQGKPVNRPCPANWQRIARIEGALPADLPPLRIACDVSNPLLGANGAAAVYAPQKGLLKSDLPRIEAEAERIARMLCAHHGQDFAALANRAGAGAAGGIAFGLMVAAAGSRAQPGASTHSAPDCLTVANAAHRAQLIAGFDLVADWLQLHAHLRWADWVITGEGRFDASSLSGKGPGMLASAALKHGKTVHVFAGRAEHGAVGTAAQDKARSPTARNKANSTTARNKANSTTARNKAGSTTGRKEAGSKMAQDAASQDSATAPRLNNRLEPRSTQNDTAANGLHLHSISPADMPLAEALAQGEALLRQAVREVFAARNAL